MLEKKKKIRNVTIRQQIGLEETIIKETEQNQLIWYGHVQRMAEGRLPKIALKWTPKQKRARGRPKKNWMEGIRKAMNERNLNEGQWEDRKQWSLGVGQRRKTFSNRYIYIYIYKIIYNVFGRKIKASKRTPYISAMLFIYIFGGFHSVEKSPVIP